MISTQPDGFRIQISATRRVPDTLNIWHEEGAEVDLTLDTRSPYNFKFRPGSVKALYLFGILGQTDPDRVLETLKAYYKTLQPGGEIYLIEPDFDYITRAAVGGDINAKDFSKDFTRKTYFNLQYIAELLNKIGVPADKHVIWYDSTGLKFSKHHFEVIVSGKKPNV